MLVKKTGAVTKLGVGRESRLWPCTMTP
jgi:hypothetical protein